MTGSVELATVNFSPHQPMPPRTTSTEKATEPTVSATPTGSRKARMTTSSSTSMATGDRWRTSACASW